MTAYEDTVKNIRARRDEKKLHQTHYTGSIWQVYFG